MKKLLSLASLALAISLAGGVASAYQPTGAVKKVTDTELWPHWQELRLEKGDVSVSRPCTAFIAEVRQRRVYPPPMNLTQCMALASLLSDIEPGEHDSLRIGSSIWAPYWPVTSSTETTQPVVSPADFAELQRQFVLTKAIMVSQGELQDQLVQQAKTLRAERRESIRALREELIEYITLQTDGTPSDALLALLARVSTLEEVVARNTTSAQAAHGRLDELVKTVEGFDKVLASGDGMSMVLPLESRLNLLEEAVNTITASTEVESQLKVLTAASAEAKKEREALRQQLTAAESSFTDFKQTTTARLDEVDGRMVELSNRIDTLAEATATATSTAKEADKKADEAKEVTQKLGDELEQKASADSVATLEKRVGTLEQQASAPVPWYQTWWLPLVGLGALLLIFLLPCLFQRKSKKQAKTEDAVEELAVSEIQDRYRCPNFSVRRLNASTPWDDPLELVFTDIHPGAVNTKVHLKRVDTEEGPYLSLIGVKDTMGRNRVKPDKDGRFSALSLLKALQEARSAGSVVGLGKA